MEKTLHEIGEKDLRTLLDRANSLGISKDDIVQILVTPKGDYKLIYESN
jgi:hypothetical protein